MQAWVPKVLNNTFKMASTSLGNIRQIKPSLNQPRVKPKVEPKAEKKKKKKSSDKSEDSIATEDNSTINE